VAGTGALLFLLQRRDVGSGTLRDWAGGYVMSLLLLVSAGYWLTHKRFVVTIPGAQTFSALGPYQASVSLVRLLASPVAASPGMQVADQTVAPVALEEEPVTVVVVMGEGVSPLRLSLFGFKDETTPRLSAWNANPPAGFELISKIGFSGGVATFGSVPSFIKMAYWPVESEWRGVNLFDLAHRSGFKSWYFSAQSRHFLDAAGGAPGSDRVVTDQGNVERLARQHDDMLVDLAREVPAVPKRRFVFFHQRVNHSNYTSHCSHLPAEEKAALYAIKTSDNSRDAMRRNAYDNGLRCWDRNVDELAKVFLSSPGAVYIFATADHGEMMGEHGLWGHSQPDMRVAQVPMLLMTNRPKSVIARRFAGLAVPNWYELSRLVAAAMGHDVGTPNAREGRFYLNTTMPFGRSGYMEVDHIAAARFKVRHFTREGHKRSETEVALPELAAANAAAAASN
jgi:glucan phosphoethanolaminetransferase (alkaline phosphatase superfamily)